MRDYPVVQGCILFIAVVAMLINLVVDLLYVFFDPRIEYSIGGYCRVLEAFHRT